MPPASLNFHLTPSPANPSPQGKKTSPLETPKRMAYEGAAVTSIAAGEKFSVLLCKYERITIAPLHL